MAGCGRVTAQNRVDLRADVVPDLHERVSCHQGTEARRTILRSRYVRPLGHTAGMTFTTRMLTPETWDDFAALVEASNGVWGGCWCMGFHPEGVGAGHTREGNREAKRRHVARGTVHQVLVYDGDRCVGWCQFGSPPELPNINNRRTYDQGADHPPDWRIGCIFTNAKDRGKGVAAAAVAAALDEIKRAGGGVVEAYPERTEKRLSLIHI